MLYLIGGTRRTGKSSLARRLVRSRPMLWTSTDMIQWVLKQVAPQLGVASGVGIDGDTQEAAFRPYLHALCSAQEFHEQDSVIEGHVIHPRFVNELRESGADVRACFIGWSRIDHSAFIANQGRNTWLLELPEEEQEPVIGSVITASEHLAGECRRFDLPFVDMALGAFETQQEKALSLLLQK